MYACVYMCVYILMYLHMYMYMHVYTHTHPHIHIRTHKHPHTYISIYIRGGQMSLWDSIYSCACHTPIIISQRKSCAFRAVCCICAYIYIYVCWCVCVCIQSHEPIMISRTSSTIPHNSVGWCRVSKRLCRCKMNLRSPLVRERLCRVVDCMCVCIYIRVCMYMCIYVYRVTHQSFSQEARLAPAEPFADATPPHGAVWHWGTLSIALVTQRAHVPLLRCVTRSYVRHDPSKCATRLVHLWDVKHSYVRHNSFMSGTWLIHMCDMTHSWVRHDSFICVTWLIHMCDITHSW